MKTSLPRPILALAVAGLALANIAVYWEAFGKEPAGMLAVSFLDVGQGDAILVTGPTGIEILVDGGKDRSALRALPRVMRPLDRHIDAVIATHPDADHIGGLPDVLARYRVEYLLTSGRDAQSSVLRCLEDASAREPGMAEIRLREGMRLHLGGGAYADVLHPGENVDKLRDTNDASVVLRLVYGDTEFLLSGDAPAWVEERLAKAYGSALKSDVLKAGHHGSKTSTAAAFLAAADPEVVVVSAGKDNSYGHPHQEVLDRIRAAGAPVLLTSEEGTITFLSDGKEAVRR